MEKELIVKFPIDETGLPTVVGGDWSGEARKLYLVVHAIEHDNVEYTDTEAFEAHLEGGTVKVRVPSQISSAALWVIKEMVRGMASLFWDGVVGKAHMVKMTSGIAVPGGPVIAG
jgi:hypothetical protein